jgi:hypothetical protein
MKDVPLKYGHVNALYSGDVDGTGNMHGYGELTVLATNHALEGVVYVGIFVQSEFQGVGRAINSKRGETVTGTWINAAPDGVAFTEHSTGESYFGQYKNSRKHGVGIFISKDGIKLTACFSDDKHHGICLSIFPDGSKDALTYNCGEVVSFTSGLAGAFTKAHILI